MTHFKPASWNAVQDGNTTEFRGKWINYLSDNGWATIDPIILGDRTATKLPYNIELPNRAKDSLSLVVNNKFSMLRHISESNGDNSEPDFEMSMRCLADRNVVGHADPNDPTSWIYPNAWEGVTLRYGVEQRRSPRIVKTLEIDPTKVWASQPYLSYSFEFSSSNMELDQGITKTRVTKTANKYFEFIGETLYFNRNSEIRGVTLKAPICWWFENGVRKQQFIRTSITVQRDLETMVVTKNVPASALNAARTAGSILYTDATLHPDANPETNSVDGITIRFSNNSTWDSLHDGVGTNHGDVETENSWQSIRSESTTDEWDSLRRLVFLFDTSILRGAVLSATMSVYGGNVSNNFSGSNNNIGLFSSSPASNSDLVNGDFDLANWGDTMLAGDWLTAGSTGSAYRNFSLTGAGIALVNTNGVSKFGLRLEGDASDTPPTWASNTNETWTDVRFADYEGTSSDPKLVVITKTRSLNRQFLVNFARI
jgi:hypothetical protein